MVRGSLLRGEVAVDIDFRGFHRFFSKFPGRGWPVTARKAAFRGIGYFVITVWAIMTVLSFVWIIVTSFKTDQEIFSKIWGLPARLHFSNYVRAWVNGQIGTYFFNSIIYVGLASAYLAIAGSMSAYVFTKTDVWRWSKYVYLIVLFGMSMPAQLAIIPLYINFAKFHLLNSYQGLLIAYAAIFMPFTVFVLTGFFRTIPKELEQAAFIDGATQWQTYWLVIMPIALPGLLTVTIFNLISVWNEYLFAMILISKDSLMPVSAGLYNLYMQQRTMQDWSAIVAGVVISFTPTLLTFVFLQRLVEEGVTAGALKS
jgi:N-acetylglucosamine transport system permease protein